MKTRKLLCFPALFLVLFFSAPVTAADRPGTVSIGVFLPMTGPDAEKGHMMWAGIKVAGKMEPVVFGRKVELTLADTMSDSSGTMNAMSRLVKGRVCAMIGEGISGRIMDEAQIAGRAMVPVVSPSAISPMITENRRYIFSVCFSSFSQGKLTAKYVYDVMGARKAAIMIDIAQDTSIALANSFVENFIKIGGSIVVPTYFQRGDHDLIAQLSEVRAACPDLIYIPAHHTEVALACRQAAKLGMKVPVFSSDMARTPELIQTGGEDVEGVMFIDHFAVEAANTDLSKNYIVRYAKETGNEAGVFDALGADAYFVLLDAIKRSKSTRGSNITAALAKTKNFGGVSGIINTGKDGNATKSAVIFHVKEGRYRYLSTVGL